MFMFSGFFPKGNIHQKDDNRQKRVHDKDVVSQFLNIHIGLFLMFLFRFRFIWSFPKNNIEQKESDHEQGIEESRSIRKLRKRFTIYCYFHFSASPLRYFATSKDRIPGSKFIVKAKISFPLGLRFGFNITIPNHPAARFMNSSEIMLSHIGDGFFKSFIYY